MAELQVAEVEQNYDYFQRHLSGWLLEHRGKYALLRHRQLVQMFDSFALAYRAGKIRFDDATFSVQEVTDEPVQLGAASVAVS